MQEFRKHENLMKRRAFLGGALAGLPLTGALAAPQKGKVGKVRSTATEWLSYGGDKATGKAVGEVALPRNATGAPMTYMLNGKQFIVVPTGGANLPAELIALCLP